MSSKTLHVLWIQDSRTGHINKVKGFLSALASGDFELELTVWKPDWRLSCLRQLLGPLHQLSRRLPLGLLLRNRPEPNSYDLIVSSGGLTQWPNMAMAHRLKISNIYLGSLRNYPPSAYTLVPMTDPPNDRPPYLKLEVIPSEVTPASAKAAARQCFPGVDAAWSLLVGGDGEGMHWSREDYRALLENFLKQARVREKKVFVATSRRTPADVEAQLKDRCKQDPAYLGGAWFHDKPADNASLIALLGASSKVVVTADSVSMTHEAIASGAQVLSVFPSASNASARHQAQFNSFEAKGRLARVAPTTCDDWDAIAPECGWVPLCLDSQAALATAAFERLKLG